MGSSVIIISSWFSNNKAAVEGFNESLNDFRASTVRFYIEDFIEDRTGRVFKNILSVDPCVFVLIDLNDSHIEFIAKRTYTSILCVKTNEEANALGKAVRSVMTIVNPRDYIQQ